MLYSSIDGVSSDSYEKVFRPVERAFDVRIVYGRRPVDDPCTGRVTEAEVLLVDVFHCNRDRLNVFKGVLSQKFGVHSERFESHWEFEQYVRLAEPGFEALRAIGCDGAGEPVVLLAHEYMGMPTALKAIAADAPNTRTVFYAHEVASVRPVVEDHPGHDTMFYNVMRQAGQRGQCLEELFTDVQKNYKHPLVKAARHCDHVFAVGDYVEAELRFVDSHFQHVQIDRMYNGIPSQRVDAAGRLASRDRMGDYAEKLLGYRPTWIFTHVCRPVRSKGLWRDLGVLHALEPLLAAKKETAAYFLLGTLGGVRRSRDVAQMERVYGWPVGHEEGYPDLAGGEEQLGGMVDHFNRDHEAVRAVFVNQWGWSRAACGLRMSEEMTFADIRRGTDVELGLSIYEPFGISQFEPLSFRRPVRGLERLRVHGVRPERRQRRDGAQYHRGRLHHAGFGHGHAGADGVGHGRPRPHRNHRGSSLGRDHLRPPAPHRFAARGPDGLGRAVRRTNELGPRRAGILPAESKPDRWVGRDGRERREQRRTKTNRTNKKEFVLNSLYIRSIRLGSRCSRIPSSALTIA